jgi:hypothetical protein
MLQNPYWDFEIVETFSDLIKRQESATILLLPGGGSTMLSQILVSSEFAECFKIDSNNWKPILLDLSLNSNDIEMTYNEIKSIIANKSLVTVVVDNFTISKESCNTIRKIRILNRQYINLFFFTSFGDLKKYQEEVSSYPEMDCFAHNIYEFPYFNPDQADSWIKYNLEKLNIKIAEAELLQRIKSYSGGTPKVIKNYLRFYNRYKDPDKVEKSSEMGILLKGLWKAIAISEQNTLLRVYANNNAIEQDKESIDYFIRNRLLSENLEIQSGWLKQILERSEVKLIYRGGNFYINDYLINDSFTERELVFLKSLHSSKILSRDKVVDLISNGNQSEWAVDQFVSRLRKKIFSLGVNMDVFTSVKGKGFRLII